MAAKATIANITDLGFQPAQLNTPTDWDTPDTGYLARILNRISVVVSDVVGATVYAGAYGVQLEYLKTAEEQFVAAELWRRLEANERSLLAVNGGKEGSETIGSRKVKNAEDAEALAWKYLSKITGEDYSSGFSTGSVSSGTFAETA